MFHLIIDQQRRRKRELKQCAWIAAEADPAVSERGSEDDEFLAAWREELLARSWKELAAHEQASGQPYYTALRFRVDHPELHSPQLAEQLSGVLAKDVSAGAVRVLMHRARELFSDLLLEQVVHSLEDGSPAAVEEELIEMNLLEYCRPALERLRKKVC